MNQQEHTSQMSAKKSPKTLVALVGLLVVLILGIICYSFLGQTKTEPKVTVKAKNTFSETLYVVTDKNYAPYSYIDAQGKYAGLDVELMNEIANRLQMNLDLKLLDWPEANALLMSGKAQIIMNMETDSVVANPKIIATIPTAEKQYVVYGREKISSVAELYGRKVASLHALPALGLDNITYIDSYKQIFQELKDGKQEFAICPIQVGNYFLKELHLQDVFPSYAVSHIYGALALLSENKDLCAKLNPIIKSLWEEGKFKEWNQKWVASYYIDPSNIFSFIKKQQWLWLIPFAIVLVIAVSVVYIVLQNRHNKVREHYMEELQEHIDFIEEQRRILTENQEALEKAKEQAEINSKAKSIFLSNMSHDIRTPMNAIIGYTNLGLRETTNLKTSKDYFKKIGAASQHLLSLINDVLEMSRIESGKMELEANAFNLAEMLHDLYTIIIAQAASRDHTLRIDAYKVENEYVVGDKLHINRVLLNLGSNAIKYTPNGGKIGISITQTGADDGFGHYQLVVQDNGLGMTEEFAAKIFNAFERERNSTISGIQGTGLGMAITKRIIEMMNGKINVKTAKGEGTKITVDISLPLANPPASNLEPLAGLNVVLLEKHPATLENIKGILTSAMMITRAATSVDDALAILKSDKPFDLCIVDQNILDAKLSEALLALPEKLKNLILYIGYESERIPNTNFCDKPIFASNLTQALLEMLGAKEALPTSKAAETEVPDQGLKNLHLLLVDDVEINREIAVTMLEMNDFIVDQATNGQEAIEKILAAAPGTFDAVLMDVQMPVKNGYEATGEIRRFEDPIKANVPIIAMTANAFEEDKKAALAAGMNGHISKPIDLPNLLSTLQKVLRTSNQN